MPDLKLDLSDHQVDLVNREIKSGRFPNAGEVPSQELCLAEARIADERTRLEALREAARSGVADIEAQRFRTFASGTQLANHLMETARKRIRARADLLAK